ncbi:hypothetical protein F4604DRAFT_1932318 [Suillus subluteus]|nr:hypothetical protein F4604DRAFT_1932318 [Suillus subluteus]
MQHTVIQYPVLLRKGSSAPSNHFAKIVNDLPIPAPNWPRTPEQISFPHIKVAASPTCSACHQKEELVYRFILECPAFTRPRNIMKSSLGTRACTLRNLLNKVHLRQYSSELLEVSQTHTFLPLESSYSTSLEPHSPLLTLWILCLPRRPRQTILSQAYRAVSYFHHSPRHSWPSVWQPPAYAQLPIHARIPVEQFVSIQHSFAPSCYQLYTSIYFYPAIALASYLNLRVVVLKQCIVHRLFRSQGQFLPLNSSYLQLLRGSATGGLRQWQGCDVRGSDLIMPQPPHPFYPKHTVPAPEHNPFTNHTLQHYRSTQPHPLLTHPPALPSLTAQSRTLSSIVYVLTLTV